MLNALQQLLQQVTGVHSATQEVRGLDSGLTTQGAAVLGLRCPGSRAACAAPTAAACAALTQQHCLHPFSWRRPKGARTPRPGHGWTSCASSWGCWRKPRNGRRRRTPVPTAPLPPQQTRPLTVLQRQALHLSLRWRFCDRWMGGPTLRLGRACVLLRSRQAGAQQSCPGCATNPQLCCGVLIESRAHESILVAVRMQTGCAPVRARAEVGAPR